MLLPLSAQAAANAKGQFTYNRIGPASPGYRLTDPPLSQCLDLGPSDNAKNYTDATATIYTDPECHTPVHAVPTGHTQNSNFQSVQFTHP